MQNYFLPLNGTKHSNTKDIIKTNTGLPAAGIAGTVFSATGVEGSSSGSSSGSSGSSSGSSGVSGSSSTTKTVSVLFLQ